MHAMMNSPRRGMIALIMAGMALLLVVGIAVAAASGGGENGNQGSAEQPQSTPVATATPAATATAVPDSVPPAEPVAEPTPVPPADAVEPSEPDAPVSATPSEPVTNVPGPEPTPDLIGAATLPISNVLPLPAGTVRAEAPIDGLDMVVMESFPPQYGLHIQAGLPSGCAKQGGYEATRAGNVITVKVYNSMPDGPVACTMIYGMYNISLNLGSDYTPGETYTVVVNDQSTTFTAQ